MKLVEEDLKQKQWAKQHWLQQEDRNTEFFYMHANQRRKTNKISQVLNFNSNMVPKQDQIGIIFSSFSQLFTSYNPSGIDLCLQGLKQCVSEAMNNILITEFIQKEVEEAI